ncbi:kinase-like domain-containing protein [Tanacetum coccineum]
MPYDSEHEPIEFSFEDLVSMTNNFSDEYLIGETSTAKVYKVKVSYSQLFEKEDDEEEDRFDVVIQRSTTGRPNRDMRNDIALTMAIRHRNIVPILGYFVEDEEKHEDIMATKYEVNGSLDKHLSDPTTLTWIRRLRICLGVARAMSYLHYGSQNQGRVIHGNIQSSRILLDDKWEPMLSGFQ